MPPKSVVMIISTDLRNKFEKYKVLVLYHMPPKSEVIFKEFELEKFGKYIFEIIPEKS